MKKWFFSSLLMVALSAHATTDGSKTLSAGAASLGLGSALVVAGGSEVLMEASNFAGELTVASVEVAGEVVIITLEAGAGSVEQVVLHVSSATAIASEVVVGSVVTVSEVMATVVGGGSVVVGHLLMHVGEVLLFIPHHEMALGLHSHELGH